MPKKNIQRQRSLSISPISFSNILEDDVVPKFNNNNNVPTGNNNINYINDVFLSK